MNEFMNNDNYAMLDTARYNLSELQDVMNDVNIDKALELVEQALLNLEEDILFSDCPES